MSFKRILIINPFGIGDVLFTTPVISNLRRAYPDAFIGYIGNRRTIDFLKCNSKINQVWAYERDEYYAVYKKNPILFLKKWMDFIRDIKDLHFDVVFDFSLNSTFGFVSMLSGISKRIGYDYRGRGRFLTEKLPLQGFEGRHVIAYYLDLLNHIGIDASDHSMEMPIAPSEEVWADQWLKDQGISGKTLIAVVPGGGQSWGTQAQNKRWPAVKYADLVDKIIADSPDAVILMGDQSEKELSQEVTRLAHRPLYSAVGETSLTQMAALFKKCRLAIVNDGGPLHVAVAVGIPTVSIFGPVDPMVYGPFPSKGHQVVQKSLACQPCYRRFRMASCLHLSCLQELSVEQVYRKVKEIL